MRGNGVEQLGGYHPDDSISKWGCGSMFAHEGLKLYDLVRKHKPEIIVEVGSWEGCSTSYLASAVRDNGKGKVISIDFKKDAGKYMPDDLREFVEFRTKDALKYTPPEKIDFLFEDGSHNTGFTKNILTRYKAPIVVCHDYLHPSHCLETVHDEMNEVLGGVTEIHHKPPYSCGLGIYVDGDRIIKEVRDPSYES